MKLYYIDSSPLSRAAIMVAFEIGAPVELVNLDFRRGEHLRPEFLKKNPLHTVPVLEDGNLILHDSHAIMQYLVDEYSSDDSLYPKEVKKRTLVNQKLFFNSGILFPRMRSIATGMLFLGQKEPTRNQLKEIEEAYGYLESFLSDSKWLAGDYMTIADISAVATFSSLVYLKSFNPKQYPRTHSWAETMQKLPFYIVANSPGAAAFASMIKIRNRSSIIFENEI